MTSLNKSSFSTQNFFGFDILPSGLILGSILTFCFIQYFIGHLSAAHLVLSFFLLVFYFLHPLTRIFLFLGLPFVLKDIIFDLLRFVPFDWLKPLHIHELYLWEKSLFGFLPHEYLAQHLTFAMDMMTALIYFIHEPIAILMILILWNFISIEKAQRYAVAYLLMNLLAFVTYLLYPSAPPWYVTQYGFSSPLLPIFGSPAGLASFDQFLGFPFSKSIYQFNPVVFGAIPSMHAGFAMLEFLYSFSLGKKWSFFFGGYFIAMCFSAVYLQHHYVLDLLMGSLYAIFAYILAEKVFASGIKNVYVRLFCFFKLNTPKI